MAKEAGTLSSLQVARALATEISEFLGADFVRSLNKKNVSNTIIHAIATWFTIAIGLGLGVFILRQEFGLIWLCLIPLPFYMATRINALNVQVHEGSHFLLANDKKTSDRLTNWLYGYWAGFDVESYRGVHLPHHKYLNEDSDPDADIYAHDMNAGGLIKRMLSDFFWITALKRLATYKDLKTEKKSSPVHLFGKAVTNIILLGSLIAALEFDLIKGGIAYGLLWMFPLLSIFPMIIRMRVMTEHYSRGNFSEDSEPAFVARTTRCNFIEKYFFGAQMEYHFEHHIFPGIPYHNQKKLHDTLWKKRFFHDHIKTVTMENAISKGYFRTIFRVLRTV